MQQGCPEQRLLGPHHCSVLQVGVQSYLLWEQAGRPNGADFSQDARHKLEKQLRAGARLCWACLLHAPQCSRGCAVAPLLLRHILSTRGGARHLAAVWTAGPCTRTQLLLRGTGISAVGKVHHIALTA